jgi:ATP-dependent helicase/nuclease subunit B
MRHELGLDLPERRIGLSAHDFAQLLGHDEVILTIRQGRRRARRRLALPAPAGSRRRRGALEGGKAPATNMSLRRAIDQPRRSSRSSSRAQAAARDAADKALGHRDRGLAARSLHHLCPPHPAGSIRSIPSTCRCRRPIAARPSMNRSASSRKTIRDALPARCRRQLRAIGEKHFAPLMERRRPRAVVAAVPAHRALVRRMGSARRGDIAPSPPRSGRYQDPARQ